jgi:hypothetical protein
MRTGREEGTLSAGACIGDASCDLQRRPAYNRGRSYGSWRLREERGPATETSNEERKLLRKRAEG